MGEETDAAREARMKAMSDRDLTRRIMSGGRREVEAAQKELESRKGKSKAKRDVENMMISCGATPKSVFRRLTGW